MKALLNKVISDSRETEIRVNQFVNRLRDVTETSRTQDGLLKGLIEEIAKKGFFTKSEREKLWYKGMWPPKPTYRD